ncbi:hypothetical protein [Paraburkholderia youngii]|uniref:hypothetical protein n=1 Tax=Paraburkholderia youngii TaxID=2782701 RepID=UPI003D1B9337
MRGARAEMLERRCESEMRQVAWAIGLTLMGLLLWFEIMCTAVSTAVAAQIPELHVWVWIDPGLGVGRIVF